MESFATIPDTIRSRVGAGEKVLLILLDAFGLEFLPRHADHPLIARWDVTPLRTQFPSTTTAHIPTLAFGQPVEQHGWYEWNVYEPKLDQIFCPFRWALSDGHGFETHKEILPYRDNTPGPTFARTLDAPVLHVTPAAYAETVFTEICADGAEITAFEQLEDGVAKGLDFLSRIDPGQGAYAYLYWDDIDTTGHLEGPSSDAFHNTAIRALDAIDRALQEAPADVTVLFTADHGQVDVSPDRVDYLDQLWPQLTEHLKPIVALRPNTRHPVVAAQQLATLDQLTRGRARVHIISGGNQTEQARQGDYLTKEQRYARTSEYIDILRRAWTEKAPFDHDGEFYKFEGFGPGFETYSGDAIPISIGGQSQEAFDVGAAKADWFTFWGEPLAEFSSERERLHGLAIKAGRTDFPRLWVTFRPIIAKTDELAWEKAHEYIGKIEQTFQAGSYRPSGQVRKDAPQNVGSQRALKFASESDLYDRALWTKTAAATNAGGASTALVGSPETVAAAMLDYIDRGASIVSIRGYDTLNDAAEYAKYVLPLVKQELAHRKATGQRGTLQAENPGNYSAEYAAYATR